MSVAASGPSFRGGWRTALAPRHSLLAVMLVSALLSTALQAANLVYLGAHVGCDARFEECTGDYSLFYSPDSLSYVQVAVDIRRNGLNGASFLHRSPGYPLLLALISPSGSLLTVLWAIPWAAGMAAAALAWMGTVFSGSPRAGLAAGVSMALWPGAYQFSAVVATDALHAFLAVVAVALTVAWLRSERWFCGAAALALWAVLQSIRPTFAVMVALWPLLLFKPTPGPSFRRATLSLWPLTAAIPLLIVLSNQIHNGMPVYSAVGAETLSAYAVPRLKEELDMGDFYALREEAWERYRTLDPVSRIGLQRRESLDFISDHPVAALGSFGGELRDQLLMPVCMTIQRSFLPLYPVWTISPYLAMHAFWGLALAGVLVLSRREPLAALFVIACFAAVMLPATLSHLVGGRLRLPVELVALSLIATAVHAAVRWRGALCLNECIRPSHRTGDAVLMTPSAARGSASLGGCRPHQGRPQAEPCRFH